MTSRTKRRLAVLALALALIAAAPQVFNAVLDQSPSFGWSSLPWRVSFDSSQPPRPRYVEVLFGRWFATYQASNDGSVTVAHGRVSGLILSLDKWYSLPPESITLRVVCAVALAGVWLLVVCGRMLARRWTRKSPTTVAS